MTSSLKFYSLCCFSLLSFILISGCSFQSISKGETSDIPVPTSTSEKNNLQTLEPTVSPIATTSFQTKAPSNKPKDSSKPEVTQLPVPSPGFYDLKYKKLAALLPHKLEEFKEAVNKLNQELTDRNVIDVLIGADLLYSLPIDDKTYDWIAGEQKKAKSHLGSFSTVYYGVSNKGYRFIALSQPMMSNNFNFTEAVNGLRDDKNEMDFLSDAGSLAKPVYAVDIYFEDLLELNDGIQFDAIKFGLKDTKNTIVTDLDEELNGLLQKYQKTPNVSNTMRNKQWNLYLFTARDLVPSEIVIDIEGEHVELTQ